MVANFNLVFTENLALNLSYLGRNQWVQTRYQVIATSHPGRVSEWLDSTWWVAVQLVGLLDKAAVEIAFNTKVEIDGGIEIQGRGRIVVSTSQLLPSTI